MARFGAADLHVETKPDLTPVSDADRDVEQVIRDRLAELRPDDVVLGEEFGGPAAATRRWIIDPIDGTKSYIRGMPTWATLIALTIEDRGVLGVVAAPALGRRWWAARGAGAFADGRPIHVSAVSELADSVLAWSGIEDWDELGRFPVLLELGRRCWRTRGIGDAWQYMLVAEGVAEIAVDPVVSLWDLAAPQVIVEEAGGRFTDFAGVATADGGAGLATNGLVHDAALAILGR